MTLNENTQNCILSRKGWQDIHRDQLRLKVLVSLKVDGERDSKESSLALLSSPPTLAILHGLQDRLGNAALPLQDTHLFH